MEKSVIKKIRFGALEFVLLVFTFLEFYPILMLILNSVKTRAGFAANPFGFTAAITISNLYNAFIKMKFYSSMINSIIISAASLVVIIIFASMASYPIARIKNRFYNFIYVLFLAGIIVPYQLAMIPLYKIGISLHFINNYHGIIIIYAALFMSFPIFIYTGFIKSVPKELEEAATIDGCGKYRTFWIIVFPLIKPATATVAVLNLLNIWNDFLLSLLFLQKPSIRTVTVALFSFRGQYHTNWPLMFAGLLLAILPIVIFFLLMQKYFIKGITAGAVKG